METIRVNMTPCEDVQTIHASQNDNEGREWGFELHNNGEKIDSSSISDQMVFKAYEGGTEQLLPENTSTPTTSPFLGDIRYPQGLLTDQEFTYRQSPTEEDGLAKITDIKGNTVVWNQLVQNGNFESTSGWTPTSTTTFTVSENVGSVTWNGTGTYARIQQGIPRYANHKYLAVCDIKLSNADDDVTPISMYNGTKNVESVKADSVNWKTYFLLFTQLSDSDSTTSRTRFCQMGTASTAEIRNAMLFDLTVMGLDISSPSEFKSLFSLPYYAYNAGTLLSFNGTGIKTVGANQWHNPITGHTINDEGEVRTSANTDWMADKILIGADKRLYLYLEDVGGYTRGSVNIAMYGTNGYLGKINALQSNPQVPQKKVITLNQNTTYVIPYGYMSGGATSITDVEMTLANIDINEYVPYTSSTLSLPISTYFPSGMKSAGSVYDELTPTKAITRIGEVDLSSLTWNYNADYQLWVSIQGIRNSDQRCLLNANIPYQVVGLVDAPKQGSKINNTYNIWIRNGSDTIQPSGIAYYILGTPTETSFSTASLVTENGEIPLSNQDGVLIGKCTEQLSAEPGFHDAKIKLSDSDGTCYSNKLQLHVERSPQ